MDVTSPIPARIGNPPIVPGDKNVLFMFGFLYLSHIKEKLTNPYTIKIKNTAMLAMVEISAAEARIPMNAAIIAIITAIHGVFRL